MAHAMKRLPIEARAKCKGTRSGVSITRVSSEGITADISAPASLTQNSGDSLRVKLVFLQQNSCRQRFHRIVGAHRHLALRYDWSTVQGLVNIMDRAATHFSLGRERLLLWIQSRKRG